MRHRKGKNNNEPQTQTNIQTQQLEIDDKKELGAVSSKIPKKENNNHKIENNNHINYNNNNHNGNISTVQWLYNSTCSILKGTFNYLLSNVSYMIPSLESLFKSNKQDIQVDESCQ